MVVYSGVISILVRKPMKAKSKMRPRVSIGTVRMNRSSSCIVFSSLSPVYHHRRFGSSFPGLDTGRVDSRLDDVGEHRSGRPRAGVSLDGRFVDTHHDDQL